MCIIIALELDLVATQLSVWQGTALPVATLQLKTIPTVNDCYCHGHAQLEMNKYPIPSSTMQIFIRLRPLSSSHPAHSHNSADLTFNLSCSYLMRISYLACPVSDSEPMYFNNTLILYKY